MDALADLDSVYDEVVEHIRSLGLVEYPRPVSGRSEAPRAGWGPDPEWRAFLDLAPLVGAGVVYVVFFRLEEGDLPEIDEGEQPDPRLASHLGQIFLITLDYVGGGVIHSIVLEASWYTEAQDESGLIAGPDQNEQVHALVDRATSEGWVQRIAEDPRFYGVKKLSDRSSAVILILGELGVVVDRAGGWDAEHRLARWLSDMASSQVDQVRAAVEDRALSEVPELVTQLVSENPDWFSWRVALREQKGKRLVAERYGWAIPVVVAEVARHKQAKD